VVVGAVEHLVCTVVMGDNSKESAHYGVLC
jgi:hypothetical protein